MKIWDKITGEKIEQPEEMRDFINEVIELMKKYNLSISHEDCHGGFIIERYDEYNVEWFKDAHKNY